MIIERYDAGVFDSGVGGLSVVRELLRSNPSQSILYLADQFHVPYGGRPLEEIRQFAIGISRFLLANSCDAIVMACNVSSATALSLVQKEFPEIPVVGMIDGVSAKVANSGYQRIGVLATQGTVLSEAYPKIIAAYKPTLDIFQVACPAFVPLVESGVLEGPEVDRVVAEYLHPLAQKRCEAIILGCTHYPFLLPAIKKVACDLFPFPPAIFDPAESVRARLAVLKGPAAVRHNRGGHLFLTTGDPSILKYQLSLFLEKGDWKVGAAEWRGENLRRLAEPVANPRT